MTAWIAKMLLKVLKPFAKMAILSAIFEAILGMVNGGTEEGGETDPTDETGE